MKIPQLLEPEDMANETDELSNMTYISYFRTWETENAKRQEKLKLEAAKKEVIDARAVLSTVQKELDLVKSELYAHRNLGRMGAVVSTKDLFKKA